MGHSCSPTIGRGHSMTSCHGQQQVGDAVGSPGFSDSCTSIDSIWQKARQWPFPPEPDLWSSSDPVPCSSVPPFAIAGVTVARQRVAVASQINRFLLRNMVLLLISFSASVPVVHPHVLAAEKPGLTCEHLLSAGHGPDILEQATEQPCSDKGIPAKAAILPQDGKENAEHEQGVRQRMLIWDLGDLGGFRGSHL